MLIQCKETKNILIKKCGIAKKDVSVKIGYCEKWHTYKDKNGYLKKYRDWDKPEIVIYNSKKYATYKYIKELKKYFDVTLFLRGEIITYMLINYITSDTGHLIFFDMIKHEREMKKLMAEIDGEKNKGEKNAK